MEATFRLLVLICLMTGLRFIVPAVALLLKNSAESFNISAKTAAYISSGMGVACLLYLLGALISGNIHCLGSRSGASSCSVEYYQVATHSTQYWLAIAFIYAATVLLLSQALALWRTHKGKI